LAESSSVLAFDQVSFDATIISVVLVPVSIVRSPAASIASTLAALSTAFEAVALHTPELQDIFVVVPPEIVIDAMAAPPEAMKLAAAAHASSPNECEYV
jgi:multisubunit Na+/H+ antiporter MnhG subunit